MSRERGTLQNKIHTRVQDHALCIIMGPSWPWSYGSWTYNYPCNRCLSLLMLWVQLPLRARCTTLCDKVCQCLAAGRWFSLGRPVSSTNKTERHDITEILLDEALNSIKKHLCIIHYTWTRWGLGPGNRYRDPIKHIMLKCYTFHEWCLLFFHFVLITIKGNNSYKNV